MFFFVCFPEGIQILWCRLHKGPPPRPSALTAETKCQSHPQNFSTPAVNISPQPGRSATNGCGNPKKSTNLWKTLTLETFYIHTHKTWPKVCLHVPRSTNWSIFGWTPAISWVNSFSCTDFCVATIRKTAVCFKSQLRLRVDEIRTDQQIPVAWQQQAWSYPSIHLVAFYP